MLESNDGGESWVAHEPPPTLKGGYGMAVFFLFDPSKKIGDRDTWLFTAQEGGFFKTTDGGKSWDQRLQVSDDARRQPALPRQGWHALYSGGYQYPARSTDNGSNWEPIKNGLVYSWYMGICGDGQNIYTACSNEKQPFFVSSEDDGMTWKPLNDQKFSAVPFEMVLDPVNHILYSASWEEGLLALKLGPKTE